MAQIVPEMPIGSLVVFLTSRIKVAEEKMMHPEIPHITAKLAAEKIPAGDMDRKIVAPIKIHPRPNISKHIMAATRLRILTVRITVRGIYG